MKTKDFGLASLLVSQNIKMIGYSTDDMSQMWFEFADTETTRQIEGDFYCATAMVNVQSYLGAQKMLKALIYQNRKNIYVHRLGTLDFDTAR